MRQLISFVIPCYHSADTIESVVRETLATVEGDGRYDCEVILVNDNAPDDTWAIIERLCSADTRVRGITMMRNFGQHAALMAGYRVSRGDVVVSLDDDGQTPPHEVFKLISKIEQGYDLVYCEYAGEEAFSSGFRRWGSNVNDCMARWLLGKPEGLYLSSYFAASRLVVDEVISYAGPYPYVDGLFLRSAGTIASVPVEHLERTSGQSGYSLGKLLGLWLNGFTAFSVKPLRVASGAGVVIALIGLILALVVVIRKFVLGAAVDAGWSSLMCAILVVGGLILAMLGLVGEYVGRTYVSMNAAPQYVVKDMRNIDR